MAKRKTAAKQVNTTAAVPAVTPSNSQKSAGAPESNSPWLAGERLGPHPVSEGGEGEAA